MGGKTRLLFKDWLLCCFVLCFVSMALGISSPVFAADDENEEDVFTLEEVTVTAEKREAELQKVPMDISVVRPDDMNRLDVHQLSDLEKMIPGLEISDVANNGNLQLQIRGVQNTYWNVTAENTVAVNVDGVSLTRSNALEGKFYDLERVEMLAGPQGTLIGRGSTAGSLSMVTKKPDIGEFGGNIQFEYGSYDRRRVEGALNIPATDKLAFRVSGRSVKRGAYDDIGLSTQDLWGARASMKWEPTDRQSLNVSIDTDSTNNKGGNNFQGVYFETYGDLEIVANDDPTTTEAFREVASGGNVSTPFKAAWYLNSDVSNSTTRTDTNGFSINYNQEFDIAWWTVKLGHRKSESFSLQYRSANPTLRPLGATVITSWFNCDTMDPETGVITPAGTAPGDDGYGECNWTRYSTYSASRYTTDGIDQWGRAYEAGDVIPETQLTLVPPNIRKNKPNSMVKTRAHNTEFETYFTSKESIANGDKMQWIAGGLWTDDVVVNDTYIAENAYNDITLREYALYGEGSYAILPGLSFSAGYRRVWDTKWYTGFKFSDNYRESSVDNDYSAYVYYEKDPSQFNHYAYHVTYDYYKFNLQWQATDTIMPYIQYSKGMKPMNIDRSTGNPIPPEQLNSLDGGIKTRLFNGRLQLNLSAYYYEYKNYNTWATVYQCRVREYDDDGNFTQCKILGDARDNDVDYVNWTRGVMSAGGAKQHGGSVQATWVITPNDRLNVNANYQHNEFDDFQLAKAMIANYEPIWGVGNVDSALLAVNQTDRTGDEFGGRPWRGNFNYNHMWFIGADVLTLALNGQYEGDAIDDVRQPNTENEYSYPGSPAYWIFGLAFTYNSTKWVPEGYRWNARLFGNNILDSRALTNRRYNDDYLSQWKYAPNSGYISGSFVTPRTLGIQFTLNF